LLYTHSPPRSTLLPYTTLFRSSEEIDVSSQTINSDITKISKFIEDKHFNLTLDTKPFVGVRLVGNEIDKRSLLGILASFVSKYHTTNEEFCHELENIFERWLS